MPPPKKLDLIPDELRRWLAEELRDRGFADILDVTEALNFRLQEAGLEITVGKTAVGDFSKALKDQREAFAIAETLLADMDVEQEGPRWRAVMARLFGSREVFRTHLGDVACVAWWRGDPFLIDLSEAPK